MDTTNDNLVQVKTCTKCGETKPVGEFPKHAGHRDGFGSHCKICKRAADAEYRRRNPEKNKEDYAKRIAENPNYWSEWYADNRDEARERVKKWSQENKETVKAMQAAWYAENGVEYHVAWRKKNREKLREQGRENYAKKRDDPKWKIENTIRVGIHRSLGDSKAGRHWESLVGYTVTELTDHLESRFTLGMTWDNYGLNGWHIDHIVPRSVFNYETPDDIDFKRCWALKNLQPLWGTDNISKGAKLDNPFQPSLALGIEPHHRKPPHQENN